MPTKNNNTHSFAHIADVHLGAFRTSVLRNLVLQSFLNAMDICIERKVDFIVISGDLFDSNFPDMSIINEAVVKMACVRQKGIEIYAIYGSHDFSLNQKSVIDILKSATLFKKVTKGKIEEGELLLEFTFNEKTGARLVGVDGRKMGLDKLNFQILNKRILEEETGFKIFVFHGMISEYKPKGLSMIQSLPFSYFPKHFDYYAGGHLHEFRIFNLERFAKVVYPGVLFAGDQTDLEMNANGQKRGFCIVTFSEEVQKVEFVENKICDFKFFSYEVDGKGSEFVQQDLERIISSSSPSQKIVIIKIKGVLETGKPSDIDYSKLQDILYRLGAKDVQINNYSLSSKQYQQIRVDQNLNEIKHRIFTERSESFATSLPMLKDSHGVEISIQLLKILSVEKKPNERNYEYDERVFNDVLKLTDLERVMKDI